MATQHAILAKVKDEKQLRGRGEDKRLGPQTSLQCFLATKDLALAEGR